MVESPDMADILSGWNTGLLVASNKEKRSNEGLWEGLEGGEK